jgi:hypothetical protein
MDREGEERKKVDKDRHKKVRLRQEWEIIIYYEREREIIRKKRK